MQSENVMPEVKTKPNEAADPWGDLVVSILAVNRYSLERTYSFCDHLRQNGLLDPSQLASLEPGEIANKLVSAGYNRGAFMTNLFASRLSSLGAHVELRGVAVSAVCGRAPRGGPMSQFHNCSGRASRSPESRCR